MTLVRSKNAQQPTSPCRSSERELLINCLQTLWSPENRRAFHSWKQNWDIKIFPYCKPWHSKASIIPGWKHTPVCHWSFPVRSLRCLLGTEHTGACKSWSILQNDSDWWLIGPHSVCPQWTPGPRAPVPWFRITYLLNRMFKQFFLNLWNSLCQTEKSILFIGVRKRNTHCCICTHSRVKTCNGIIS